MADDEKRKKTIVFLHPDLGIGGAERLVVDAAVGLQKRGHRVVIFTSHCDPRHCFDECRDGTLDVRVRGNTLIPPSLFSRFAILCAILRQTHLILQTVFLTGELGSSSDGSSLQPDAFFVDQLSAGLPLLRFLVPGAPPVLFYCHFPDLLLAQGRSRWWKRLYRAPFDALEQWSMGFATTIAVNSGFTRSVVAGTWPALARRRDLRVVYPCVDTRTPDDDDDDDNNDDEKSSSSSSSKLVISSIAKWKQAGIVLSINRFERKKDVALAIRAFAGLPRRGRSGSSKLVIAGGYDGRVAENVAHHRELCDLATELGLRHATAGNVISALAETASTSTTSSNEKEGGKSDKPSISDADVLFLLSVPAALKRALLRSARLLVYTPAREHFGIVPLEAMLARVPVLAADTGGPTETVVDSVTGWLRDPADVAAWTAVMDSALNRLSEGELARMGDAGAARVRECFGEDKMAGVLDGIFGEVVEADSSSSTGRRSSGGGGGLLKAVVGAVVACLVALLAFLVARVWLAR